MALYGAPLAPDPLDVALRRDRPQMAARWAVEALREVFAVAERGGGPYAPAHAALGLIEALRRMGLPSVLREALTDRVLDTWRAYRDAGLRR